MKKRTMIKKIFAVLVGIAICSAATPTEHNGQLKVDVATGKLVNQNNYPVQLRGMSSHGLQWYPKFMNPTAFTVLRDNWGADIVRLSMYIQEGGYETDQAGFTTLMDTLINQVTAAGLYVMIDFHQLSPGDPNANIELAKSFFAHVAQTHNKKTNLFYEICNEPNSDGGKVTWSMIKSYANTIIPIIRQYDSHNCIVVGTADWDQRPDQVIGNKVNDTNVLYTVHFYATDHTDMSYIEKAVNAKIPVIVTECGTQEASGDGVNDFESSATWFDYLDENKISWINWNFSSDERTGAVFKKAPSNYSDAAYYSNDGNLKDGGLWIKNRMKTLDDWGGAVSVTDKPVSRSNFAVHTSGSNLKLSGLNRNYPAVVKLYSLTGRQLFMASLTVSGESMEYAIPKGVIGSGMVVVTLSNGAQTLSRQVLLR